MVSAAGLVQRLPLWLEMRARRWQEGTDLELATMLTDPRRLFVDVGANAGLYGWAAARRGAPVLAVEPHPAVAGRLRRRLPGIDVVEAALSDEPGEATLYVPSTGGDEVRTRSSLEPDANAGMAQAPVRVAVRTLDDVLADHGGSVGFLKVDVEGHEAKVLRGAAQTLSVDRPAVLVEIEWRHHGDDAPQVMQALVDHGYVGSYSLDDRLHPLSSFDPDRLQADGSLKAPGADLGGDVYVNNFLFVHADDDWARARLRSAGLDLPD